MVKDTFDHVFSVHKIDNFFGSGGNLAMGIHLAHAKILRSFY